MHTPNTESFVPYPTGSEAWKIRKGRDGINRLAILDYNINVAEYKRKYDEVILTHTLVWLVEDQLQARRSMEDIDTEIVYLYNPKTEKYEIWIKKPTEMVKRTVKARIEMLGL